MYIKEYDYSEIFDIMDDIDYNKKYVEIVDILLDIGVNVEYSILDKKVIFEYNENKKFTAVMTLLKLDELLHSYNNSNTLK